MTFLRKQADLLAIFFQSVVVALACLTFSPLYIPTPHRDSGIFLFIGSQILKGKILYLQTWDNKQPLLYFINALGLWLGKGSAWGVWAVELAFLIVALGSLYLVLRKKLPALVAMFIPLGSFLTIYQIMSGNFSEEYSICFQALLLAVLFLFYLPNRHSFSRPLAAIGMGLLAGAAFCLKQTYIETALAIGLFLLIIAWLKKDKTFLLHLVLMIGGFVLINALFLLYFAVNGALKDYIINAYLINGYYSHQGLLEWLQALIKSVQFNKSVPFLFIINLLWLVGALLVLIKSFPWWKKVFRNSSTKWILVFLGMVGFGIFVYSQLTGKEPGIGLLQGFVLLISVILIITGGTLFFKKYNHSQSNWDLRSHLNSRDWFTPNEDTFLLLGLITLPVTLLTISLSGMNFNHYFISLFPSLFLLLTASIFYLRKVSSTRMFVLLFVLIIAAESLFPILGVFSRLQLPGSPDNRSLTAQYLKSVTTPDQKILAWGWESGIYFMADRQPPTRYSFQFPAYFNSPYREEVLQTLLSDIKNDPPVYIADTVDPDLPLIQGQSMQQCLDNNTKDGDPLHAVINYVCSRYVFDKSIGGINIYKLAN